MFPPLLLLVSFPLLLPSCPLHTKASFARLSRIINFESIPSGQDPPGVLTSTPEGTTGDGVVIKSVAAIGVGIARVEKTFLTG